MFQKRSMDECFLTDFCLICCNYDCQMESYHQKQSLNQLIELLVENTVLNAQIQNQFSKKHGSNFQQFRFQTNYQQQADSNIFGFKMAKIDTIYQCVQNLKNLFQKAKERKQSEKYSFYRLVLACLSSIQLMETIRTNPLLYRDVIEILKLAAVLQFNVEQAPVIKQTIPVTHKRILRTVKQLKALIRDKQENLLKFQQKFQNSAVYNNLFEDLTLSIHNTNVSSTQKIYKKNRIKKSNCKREKLIVFQLLKEYSFLKQIQKSLLHFAQKKDKQNYKSCSDIIHKILGQIKILQSLFAQRIYNDLDEGQSKSGLLIDNEQTERLADQKLLYDQEKSVYPLNQGIKKSQISLNCEQVQTLEFAYIEGVPFPANRRSLNFSMFQLTDQLLLNYMPALEKLKALQEICIRKNKLTLFSYRLLKNTYPNLRCLDIRQNHITQQIVQLMFCFKSLNILYLSECHINPVLLIKICINLPSLNVLYCDRLNFVEIETGCEFQSLNGCITDFRGIFYIMCLNLKKLMYFSLKGHFSEDAIKYGKKYKNSFDSRVEQLSKEKQKEIQIFSNIYQTLKKRHGILQI